MEILDYINSHLDTWQKDLTSAPYYLKINTSGNYHLLKYDMLNSDFHESIVREARGSIFYFDEDIEKYICVSHPFDKFFNFGEVYADTIDWNTASIQEKIDGCFTAKDRVLLADGTSLEIGKIVKDKMDVEVLSYNNETGNIEPKKIIGWKISDKPCPVEQFRTIKLKKVKTSLYGKLSQYNIITPTINHVFFRKGQNGEIEEVSADKLVVNDILYTPKYGLTNIEKQVILGTLLGDGSMTYYQEVDNTREKGIRFTHSRKQKDYVWYKYSLLKNLGGKPVDKEVKNSFNCEKTFYQSNTHSGISELYPIVYNNYKKQVNKKWLEQLDWLGMAIWYMDDGNYDKGSVSGSINLHTEGFSIEENELIHNFYNEKGLKNYIRDDTKGHYFIHFSTEASEIIWSAIAKYIPKCMEYKLPERFKNCFQDIVDIEERPIHLCEGIIENIEEGLNCHNTYHSKSVFKYDIEVADNHNYFCQGVLVHNSLIKFWWHANKWHISTNGLVDAAEANVESLVGNNLTFYDLVLRAIDENYDRVEFMTSLDKNYTYMFELVAKENKLVVSYDKTALYFLGRRDNRTDKEVNPDEDEQAKFFKMPRRFKFASLNDTIKFAETLDISQEGFVVCDANFNRIKIKGAAYLDAFHFRGNGLTKKKIIEAILHNTIDDMSAYFPEFYQEISQITVDFLATAKMLDVIFENIPENIMTSRKDIALYVQNFPKIIQGFIFYKFDNKGDGYSYMKERLNSDKILSLLKLDLPVILDEKKEN